MIYYATIMYIFLDESGDLGFETRKEGTSHNFIITFLITKDKRGIEKIVKKIFRNFSKKEIKRHHGMLHAFRETKQTRIKILSLFKTTKNQRYLSSLSIKKRYTQNSEIKNIYFTTMLSTSSWVECSQKT